jgi:hypothetical protein
VKYDSIKPLETASVEEYTKVVGKSRPADYILLERLACEKDYDSMAKYIT